jgi:hypothetical protein
MKTTQTTISPKQAEAMLERNLDTQRKVQQKKVDQYAAAMLEGRWKLNGISIKFDTDGRLQDGQHRLWACVQSGVPFETLLVTEMDPDVFDTIDTGVARDAGTIMGIAGVVNSRYVAGAVRWVTAIQQGRVQLKSGIDNFKLMPDQILAAYREMPGIETSVNVGHQIHKVCGFAAVMSALHYLLLQKEPEEAARFFHDLKEGVGLGPNDPVWKLRERLTQRITRRTKPAEAYILTVRAWNARLEGREMKKITLINAGDRGTPMRAAKRTTAKERDEYLPVELGVV